MGTLNCFLATGSPDSSPSGKLIFHKHRDGVDANLFKLITRKTGGALCTTAVPGTTSAPVWYTVLILKAPDIYIYINRRLIASQVCVKSNLRGGSCAILCQMRRVLALVDEVMEITN